MTTGMNGLGPLELDRVEQHQHDHARRQHDLGRERVPVDRRRRERHGGGRSEASTADQPPKPVGRGRVTAGFVTSKIRPGKNPRTTIRMTSGTQAIHSGGIDVVDVRIVGELLGGRAERGALVEPEQVAGGEHGAERGDHHQVRNSGSLSPGAGL